MRRIGPRRIHPASRLQRLRQAGLPVVLDIRIDREVRVAGGGRNESLQQHVDGSGGGLIRCMAASPG